MWNATDTSIFGTLSLNEIGLFLGIILAFIGIYRFALFISDRKKKKIEDRLNLFYLPLNDALKELNVNQIMSWTKKLKMVVKNSHDYDVALILINNSVYDFMESYNNIKPYIKSASDETNNNLALFTGIFEDNCFFKEKIVDFKPMKILGPCVSKVLQSLKKDGCIEQYEKDSEHILEYYQILKITIDSDIESLKRKSLNL
jgi:hypothetical protein